MSDTRDRNLENKSPDELEQDIEETRARIRGEMGALGYKLGPEGLRDSAEDALDDTQETVISVTEQLKKGVIESSDSIGGRLSAFIKQNPVPATLFGVGLAWLLKQGQESRGGRSTARRGGSGGGTTQRVSRGRSRSQSRSEVGGNGRNVSRSRSEGRDSRNVSRSRSTGAASGDTGETIVANKPSGSDGSGRSAGSYERANAGAAQGEDEAFRSHYESNFSANGDFEDYEPAYRYGFDLASESEFQGKPWRDARGDVKRRWDEERNEPWYKFDEAVEHGYTTAQSRR